jgi:hypothetical protein
MNEVARRKSPRAPSIPLDEAIERVSGIYDKERRHPAPTEVIAQDLGYKSANNGSALSMLASLRSFGLLEKAQEGKLAVSKDVETYRFAPTEELKSELRIKWLRNSQVFSELLDRCAGGLPSDASLRFDLIQRGFSPASAESTLAVFKQSVEFAKYFEQQKPAPAVDRSVPLELEGRIPLPESNSRAAESPRVRDSDPMDVDRIPVRLTGGRRAWLEIPVPFYEADKERLIAQIKLILTEDDAPEA